MTKLLHIHHDDHLHEVAYVKAVRRRVKANVKFHFLILQKLPDLFLVRGLFDKSPSPSAHHKHWSCSLTLSGIKSYFILLLSSKSSYFVP